MERNEEKINKAKKLEHKTKILWKAINDTRKEYKKHYSAYDRRKSYAKSYAENDKRQ
jgi:predicted metal-dependent peptidase